MPKDRKRVASDSDSDSGPDDKGPVKKVSFTLDYSHQVSKFSQTLFYRLYIFISKWSKREQTIISHTELGFINVHPKVCLVLIIRRSDSPLY